MVKPGTHRLNLVFTLPCHARELKNPQAINRESQRRHHPLRLTVRVTQRNDRED